MSSKKNSRSGYSDKHRMTINGQIVESANRAVVVIDAKSFSITSNDIQQKVGSPEVVLIYQMAIRRRIEECIRAISSLEISIEYQYTGGDAAILLFEDAISAHKFLLELNNKSQPGQILFSAGATYGSVAFYSEAVAENDVGHDRSGIAIMDVAGYPISLGARLQSDSQAGRLLCDGEFYRNFQQLSKEGALSDKKDLDNFYAQGPIKKKNTHIEETYSFDYINDPKLISDTGSITLTTGTRFVLSDWPNLWKLLMGGELFLTMNRLKPINWYDRSIGELSESLNEKNSFGGMQKERLVQVRHMSLINEIYPKFDQETINEIFPAWENFGNLNIDDVKRCCRLFIYDNEADAKNMGAVIEYHKAHGVGCRKISFERYDNLIKEKNRTFPGAFSISQIDGVWYIANYEYDTVTKFITFINIPKLTMEQVRDYLNTYFEIYLQSEIV